MQTFREKLKLRSAARWALADYVRPEELCGFIPLSWGEWNPDDDVLTTAVRGPNGGEYMITVELDEADSMEMIVEKLRERALEVIAANFV